MNNITVNEISAILLAVDPMHIDFADNTGRLTEYDSEAELIHPLLTECDGADDVQELVYATFTSQFSPVDVGRFSGYRGVAAAIWKKIR